MGKQSSVFLAISILATIAAGTGFFLLYQQQQETRRVEQQSQRVTSRLAEAEEILKKAETAAREAQSGQQHAERMMRASADVATTDKAKIATLEQDLKHATDALHALEARQQAADAAAELNAQAVARAIPSPEPEPTTLSNQAAPSTLEQEKQLDALHAELAALQQQKQDAESRFIELQQQTQKDQEQLAALQEQNQEYQKQVAALQEQNQEYQKQVAALQEQNQESQKQLAALQEQNQESQKQLAALQEQNQEYQKQNAALQEEQQKTQELLSIAQRQNQEQLVALQTADSKALSLQADLRAQEEEYRKLKDAHDLSLANLQAEIANENIEKATIQQRLGEELDRSNKEYQARLDSLAQKKEEEIQQLRSLAETYQNLTHHLEKEIEDKTVHIEQIQEKLRVVIVDQILFASGSAQISREGVQVSTTIGDELKRHLNGRQIGIEGHTDNQVVGKRLQNQYATNWELSSARATNVLRYLQEALKIPGSQLFAVGYGSHHPAADNSTEEGRRLNRRIEIVLTPQLERSRKEE